MSIDKKHSSHLWGVIALLLCALIWGTAFVAQSIGGQNCEPFTFNCVRNFIATIFLLAICPLQDILLGKKYSLWGTESPILKKRLWLGGTLSGVCLNFAIFMQQWGLMYTSTGKSGFITALYIVLVPILGMLFFCKHVGRNNWLAVVIAVIGMYFICITESLTITKGDLITLACPVLFSLQILVVDYFIKDLDGVRFSMIQFGVAAVLSAFFMLILETPSYAAIVSSLGPLLYLAIVSSGIAYTLQIIGQKYVNTVLASMLMSLESVFALLSGWLLLNQVLSLREITGCILVFAAILLAQLPHKSET